jgi:hypothetical protein
MDEGCVEYRSILHGVGVVLVTCWAYSIKSELLKNMKHGSCTVGAQESYSQPITGTAEYPCGNQLNQ